MKILPFLVCLTLLCSCAGPSVRARTFYTSRRDLASYSIDTPDPAKSTKKLGQMIWVRWNCSKPTAETLLDVTLCFTDGTRRHEQYPIIRRHGWLKIEISAQERKEHKGLLSYRIELRQGESIIATTQHKLWVTPIEVKDQ